MAGLKREEEGLQWATGCRAVSSVGTTVVCVSVGLCECNVGYGTRVCI